jgi:hypothetical protein
MRAEDWSHENIELEGWPILIVSFRLGDNYVVQAESTSSGVTIARATATTRFKAYRQAIDSATRRLARTRIVDLSLTVGG